MLQHRHQHIVRSPDQAMSDYTTTEACPVEDAEEICALWVNNLESGCMMHASKKLEKAYASNPVMKGTMIQIHDKLNTSAGTIGLLPRRFFYNCKGKISVALADFTVDAAHRSAGPALMLKRRAILTGIERFAFIFGLPNIHARAISRRAGMCSLGTFHRYTLVLKSKSRLSRYMKPRWVPFFAPIVDRALALRRYWKAHATIPVLSCRASSFSDPAIDRIWAQRPTCLLLSDRSTQVLEWRYSWTLEKQWRISVFEQADNIDAGYIVWRIEDDLIIISDFFCIDPAKLTRSLLAAFIKHAKAENAHSITVNFLGSPQVISAFLDIGFLCSNAPGDPVYVANESQINDIPAASWYLTDYDNDD